MRQRLILFVGDDMVTAYGVALLGPGTPVTAFESIRVRYAERC